MLRKVNKMQLRRMVSVLLIVVLTTCYVVRDSGISKADTVDNSTAQYTTQLADNLTECYSNVNTRTQPVQCNTEIGKITEKIDEEFETLETVVENGDPNKIKQQTQDFREIIAKAKETAQDELAAMDLSKFSNSTILNRFNNYKTMLGDKFEALEIQLDTLESASDKKAANAALEEISEVSTEVMEDAVADLPFNIAEEYSSETEEYTGIATAENNDLSANIPDNSDLAITNDTKLSEKVKEETKEYDTALEIYNFVKNSISYEGYYGARKGAAGAYDQKAGNDYDQASLMIALLRTNNIPAHYVRGNITITADQAIAWTATDDIKTAVDTLASMGVPTIALTSSGKITAVRVEHVWVEAYVPYSNYRGSGSNIGKKIWVSLDPSYKKSIYYEGVEVSSIVGADDALADLSDEAEYTECSNNAVSRVNVETVFSGSAQAETVLEKYLTENGYNDKNITEVFGGKEIIAEKLNLLPLSLPYRVTEVLGEFADIPEELTDKIEISLSGNSPYGTVFSGSPSFTTTVDAPDVYNKRITLSWVAATDADQEIITAYGDIFHTPAYLVEMKPQLCIDGEVVKEGSSCGLGYRQSLTMVIKSPNTEDAAVANTVTAGGMYCIALDYGSIGADELTKINANIEALKSTISESNIYTEAALGELLNAVAKGYFAQVDIYNKILAGQNNVTETRALSVGMTGYSVDVKYTFQIPAEIKQGSLYVDIDRDVKSVVPNDRDNPENAKAFMLQSGIFASAMEHRILEQMTGVESLSTIKVLAVANEQGIPIYTVTKDNYSDIIGKLDVTSSIKDAIKTAVSVGNIVMIPQSEVQIYNWSGSGYIILDTVTYAAGYMISGGIAGGAMSVSQMLSEYVTYVIEGLVCMILFEIIQAVLFALIGNWALVLIWGISLIFIISCINHIIDLVQLYNITGEVYYLQEIVVELGAILTLGFIRLGPAKNAFDSLQTFTYALTTLAKTGASTETCMAFIKTYGTARLASAERAIGTFKKCGFSDTQLANVASNFSYDYIAAIETGFARIGVLSSSEIDTVLVLFKQAYSISGISEVSNSLAVIKNTGISLINVGTYGVSTINGINSLATAFRNGIAPSTVIKLLELGVGAGIYESLDITSESKAQEYIQNVELQKSVLQAKQSASNAIGLAEKYGYTSKKPYKTVAYDGATYTLSGWGELTNQPEFNRSMTPEDVFAKCNEIGYVLINSGAADQGVPGQYNACHAEKQLSLITKNPIGISRIMCQDCKRYFSKLAIAEKRIIITSDPEGVRIFYPDGTVKQSN